MQPQKITLWYGHVASNLGDLAINQGQIRLLAAAFPEALIQVVLLDAHQNQFLQSAKSSFGDKQPILFSFLSSNYEKALFYHAQPEKLLIDCGADDSDLIVLASGEHLFAYARPENTKSIFWRTIPALAAKASNKPCLMLPSTFGPFEDSQVRDLLASFFTLVDNTAAREPHSARILRSIFKKNSLPVLLDPAFFIDAIQVSPIVEGADPGLKKKNLGIIMRSEGWGIRLSKDKRETLTDSFKSNSFRNSIAYQFSIDLTSNFLKSDPSASVSLFIQTSADEELANHLMQSLSESGCENRIRLIKPASVQDYLFQLTDVDFVVASRFHAIILALISAKPVFGVYFDSHGHKLPGLFDLFGISSECANLSVLSPQIAAQLALKSIFENKGDWLSVQSAISKYKEQTLTWLSQYENLNPGSRTFIDAYSSFGKVAFSLARYGFDLNKKQSIQILQKEAAEKKVEYEKAKSQIRKTEAKAQDQKKEYEQRLSEVNRVAEDQKKKYERQLSEANRLVQDQKKEYEQQLSEANRLAQDQKKEYERQLSEAQRHAQETEQGLKSQIASTEQENLKATLLLKQDFAKTIQHKKKRVKGHLSYRLGKVLVDNSSPLKWYRIPYRLYRARQEHKKDKEAIALVTMATLPVNETKPEDADTLKALNTPNSSLPIVAVTESVATACETNGIQAAIKMVDNLNKKEKPLARAMALIRAGKALWEIGREEAEFPFAQAALKICRAEPVLRAFFWAAQRAQEYSHSCDAILEIEKIYGDEPTSVQVELLQKLKAAPAYQLSALKKADPPTVLKVSSVSGRICYVLHNTLPYSSGGYATRSHGVATGLKKAGWDIIILSRPGFPMDIKPELTEADVTLMDKIDSIQYIRTLSPKRSGITALEYMLSAADAIEIKLREYKPAVVMAASNHVTGLPALIAARRTGLPFIYEIRGLWEITRMSRDNGFQDKAAFHVQKILEASVANRAEIVFTLTEGMRQELIERGVDQQKIALLPNCCDPNRFHPIEKDKILANSLGIPETAPVIGYVGTFVDYEGLEDLAEACGLLKNRGIEFRLLLVGNENASGQDRGQISTLIAQVAANFDFTDWLIMPGRVPYEEVERYYSLIDIAPFPRKPWPVCEMVSPMKPLEALAMQKAVVVSSVQALSEMIQDEKTGLVFKKGDINSLADALSRLIRSKELRESLGTEGRGWVQRFRTWDQIGEVASKKIYSLLKSYTN